jgi:YegS/Rv2252/BmrU family lipid kinase
VKRIFIVGNPTSGTGKYIKYHHLLVEHLKAEQIDFQSYPTTSENNATAVIRTYFDDSFSDIIVIGGDGTLNETVNGLTRKVPIGIIPAGTGNDYAKCFHLGKSIKEIISTATSGKVASVDLGLCNNRKFLNGVGVGFDGQIVADLVQKQTWLRGVVKYYYHVLSILGSYSARVFNYTIDRENQKENLILLCIAKGTTFGGGFRLTPHAKLDSGKLAVCTIGALSPLKRFLNIYRLQNGTHHVLKEINLMEADSVTINANPLLESHIDGEYFGQPPFSFSIQKDALQVRCIKLL